MHAHRTRTRVEGGHRITVDLPSDFPDCEVEVLDVVAEGDRAVVRFSETGTHDGPFMGIAPTGRRVCNYGIAIYRARDGRLVEEWSVGDRLSLLGQLGAVVSIDGVEL